MFAPFRHSIFTRLALWAGLMSVGLSLLLWAVTMLTLAQHSKAALMQAVDVDLAGLADIYASGGANELDLRIDDRLALTASDGAARHYMIADDAGRQITGDVAKWPGLSARLSQAGYIELDNGTLVYARATQLGPDIRLLVAHEYGGDTALARRIGWTYLGTGLAAAMLVALLWRWRVRQLRLRIDRINQAFRDHDDSALAVLAGSAAQPDEIGELSHHSAKALMRLKKLSDVHRDTSDQVAHELRTPLMHLDMRLVKAINAERSGGKQKLLGAARGEIKHIITLLESLLDISTSQARRGDKHGLAPVDFSELVTRLCDLYADSAEDSGHVFTHDISAGVSLPGEEMQLARLVTNLLDNALKYVPAGGAVHVSLEPGPCLTITDNGPGIAEADRDRIFDRFQRGREGNKGQGAGLGLALARAIAERHGLRLSLATATKGACFILSTETSP